MWPFDWRPRPDDADPVRRFRREVEEHIRFARLEQAEELLLRHLEAEPRDPWARNKLGAVLALSGRRDEATAVFDELIADEPDFAPAWVNRGNMAFEAEDYDEAERHYQKALELDPTSAVAHNNLAAVMRKRGNITSMVRHLKRSRAADRRDAYGRRRNLF